MTYRLLGRTGVRVSPLCLGTLNFGGPTPDEEASRIVDAALDAGINFIDTANMYHGGRSEEAVGKALAGRRHRVVLATKVHGRMGDGPNDQGLSRLHIMRACDDSLRRLGTDYIDLYQVHRPCPEIAIEEVVRRLFAHVAGEPEALAHGERLHHHPRGVRRAADVADLAAADEIRQRAERFVHRDVGTGPVDLVEVDVVGAEPAQ